MKMVSIDRQIERIECEILSRTEARKHAQDAKESRRIKETITELEAIRETLIWVRFYNQCAAAYIRRNFRIDETS